MISLFVYACAWFQSDEPKCYKCEVVPAGCRDHSAATENSQAHSPSRWICRLFLSWWMCNVEQMLLGIGRGSWLRSQLRVLGIWIQITCADSTRPITSVGRKHMAAFANENNRVVNDMKELAFMPSILYDFLANLISNVSP